MHQNNALLDPAGGGRHRHSITYVQMLPQFTWPKVGDVGVVVQEHLEGTTLSSPELNVLQLMGCHMQTMSPYSVCTLCHHAYTGTGERG